MDAHIHIIKGYASIKSIFENYFQRIFLHKLCKLCKVKKSVERRQD